MKVNGHTVNFIKQEAPTHVFTCKFCEVFSNMFLTEQNTFGDRLWSYFKVIVT